MVFRVIIRHQPDELEKIPKLPKSSLLEVLFTYFRFHSETERNMNVFLKWASSLAAILISTTATSANQGIPAPALEDDSNYNEYWEHQFLFEDGSLATSQFLIANFPISKHHGLQMGTLEGPVTGDFGPRVIVKNGRSKSGWHYDADEPSLTIFQHKLSGQAPGYIVSLSNTAAEMEILFTTTEESIPVIAANNPYGLPEVTVYAPVARAFGRWRPGPEIGGAGPSGDWRTLGHGRGYALHVVQSQALEDSFHQWRRLTALSGSGGQLPILHEFATAQDGLHGVGVLVGGLANPRELTNLVITAEGDRWHVKANLPDGQLYGTVQLVSPFEDLIVADMLNGVEKLVAGSLSAIKRHKWRARYAFTINSAASSRQLKGEAIAEDILVGKPPAKRNRRLRR